jgi:hypothetical protein
MLINLSVNPVGESLLLDLSPLIIGLSGGVHRLRRSACGNSLGHTLLEHVEISNIAPKVHSAPPELNRFKTQVHEPDGERQRL